MIRYALKCSENHDFDSWFANGAAFDTLKAAGQVVCPNCGSSTVDKALMAPRVTPEGAQTLRAGETALAKLRRHVEANADYVGPDFAKQAREMHDGTLDHRPIYGEAKPQEAKKLVDDGVPVAPLPFIPKSKTN